jgi:hypothetical protein
MQENLADLNSRLADGPLPMNRFRANVVLAGPEGREGWEDDDWSSIEIGEVDCGDMGGRRRGGSKALGCVVGSGESERRNGKGGEVGGKEKLEEMRRGLLACSFLKRRYSSPMLIQ